MLRRLFNTFVETAIIGQPESIIYPSPFTKSETACFGWLTSVTPCFPINVQNITILNEPQQFYDFIANSCRDAKERITVASLYLGSGQLEHKLVDTILDNPYFKTGKLQINVLLDYTRGSRLKFNSRVVLKPLLEQTDASCNISLYHTPELRGLRKKFAPPRWNELFGLQHMKLYIFDDTLVISGANLSNDYFTNRQDRYYVVKDRDLSDFYCGLVGRVQEFSLKMDANDDVRLNDGWSFSPYEGNKFDFTEKARDSVVNYVLDAKERQNVRKKSGDTWVFPLIQMGQLGVKQDSLITDRLLQEAPNGSSLYIATGYFNLTPQYMDTLLTRSRAYCKLLTAHPDANGFQGAKGPAGAIPAAYCLIADKFRRRIDKLGQTDRVTLREYFRKGWTYHVKGLWYYAPESEHPCLTLIGSPNFGERSVKRDLETQIAVITENPELRRRMHEECEHLYKLGQPPESDRNFPAWVHAMVLVFRGYF